MIVLHYDTATPTSVIAYAAYFKPHTLAVLMDRLAEIHRSAALEMRDTQACQAAISLSASCAFCADILRQGATPEDKAAAIAREVRTLVPCYQAACDMLRIPRDARTSIMARHLP